MTAMAVEWSLLIYSVLVGIAIGPFAVMALTGCLEAHRGVCKWGALVGLASIALGGVAAFTHLAAPQHIIYIFTNLGSAMGLEMLVTVFTGLVAALFAAQMWFDVWPGGRRIVAVVGLIAALASVLLIGRMYMLPARPMWNTWLLPLTFLTTSVVSGLLAMLVLGSFAPLEKGEDRSKLLATVGTWALGALVVNAIVAVLYFVTSTGQVGETARLFSGDLALGFWLGLVVIGIVAPLVLTYLGSRPAAELATVRGSALIAFLLVVASGIAVRAMIYGLGTAANILAG